MSCNSFRFQYIKLLFQGFIHISLQLIIDYFSYHNSLQVDVTWFMCYSYLISPILKVQQLLCFSLMNYRFTFFVK
jgi:hypothetical protein